MNALVAQFIADEHGQDLVEYSLLLAFVIMCAASLIWGMGDSVKCITNVSTSQLNAADAMLH